MKENDFLKGEIRPSRGAEKWNPPPNGRRRVLAKRYRRIPNERIQNYLDRFNEILDREDPENRERGIEGVKKLLYRINLSSSRKRFPNGYFKNQRRLAREQGMATSRYRRNARDQLAEVIVADQKSSLGYMDRLSFFARCYISRLAKILGVREALLGMGEVR